MNGLRFVLGTGFPRPVDSTIGQGAARDGERDGVLREANQELVRLCGADLARPAPTGSGPTEPVLCPLISRHHDSAGAAGQAEAAGVKARVGLTESRKWTATDCGPRLGWH